MLPEESIHPRDWIRIAEKDLSRVERSLRDADPELAGFCLQQAVEKFLKAFLLRKGWQLRRIHDLEALLDDAVGHDPAFERFRPACQRITKYYMLERYPLMAGSGLTQAEVRDSFEAIRALVQRVRTEARS
jgi:HEPN domain-containing protein